MVCSEFISEHDTLDCQTRMIIVSMTSESTFASETSKAESGTDVGGKSRDMWRRSGRNERVPELTTGSKEILTHSQRELLLDVLTCGFTSRLRFSTVSLSSSD
jgi:hypothetical protein